jgi:hypothetical protein
VQNLLFSGDYRKAKMRKRKSMPSKGVETAASKKSNLKFLLEKQTVKRQNPHVGMVLPFDPTCSKMDSDALVST